VVEQVLCPEFKQYYNNKEREERTGSRGRRGQRRRGEGRR
jgi:hypothetical protein